MGGDENGLKLCPAEKDVEMKLNRALHILQEKSTLTCHLNQYEQKPLILMIFLHNTEESKLKQRGCGEELFTMRIYHFQLYLFQFSSFFWKKPPKALD